jgi:hypothetical protein
MDLDLYLDPQCIGSMSSDMVPYYLADITEPIYTQVRTKHYVKGYSHLAFIPQTVNYKGLRKLLAYGDYLGLGGGLSLIWDMLPFSFLIDYVLTVDEALEQFSKNFTELPVQPAYFGYSLKRDIVCTGTTSVQGYGASGTIVYSDYLRERVPIPKIGAGFMGHIEPESLHWQLPSLTQWENLIALIAAMFGGNPGR